MLPYFRGIKNFRGGGIYRPPPGNMPRIITNSQPSHSSQSSEMRRHNLSTVQAEHLSRCSPAAHPVQYSRHSSDPHCWATDVGYEWSSIAWISSCIYLLAYARCIMTASSCTKNRLSNRPTYFSSHKSRAASHLFAYQVS